ncbi:MAG: acetyl-coenzyme A synthetase N-terminal domain-containing protein [Pyrinomonadaceae bacterium]
MSSETPNIESTLHEERVFQPAESFSRSAQVRSMEEYERLRREAQESPDVFWARAADELHWFRKWDTVLNWQPPHARVVCRRQDQHLLQLS